MLLRKWSFERPLPCFARKDTHEKPMRILNMIIFLMSAGFYIMMPLLGKQLIVDRRIDVMIVTLIMNSRVVVQDLFSMPAGFLADRIGNRNSMIIGSLARGTGFLLFSLTDSFSLLLLAGFLTGIGGSFFFPAVLSLYTGYTDENNRMHVFANREMLNSLGAVVGSVLGTVLLFSGFLVVGLASAAVFYISTIIIGLYIWDEPHETTRCFSIGNELGKLKSIFKDRGFVIFSLITMVIMQFLNQHAIVLPMRLSQFDPAYPYIGFIFSGSYVMMVLLQVKTLDLAKRYLNNINILSLSVGFYVISYLIMGFVDSIWAMYLGTAMNCIGTMLFGPTRNVLITQHASQEKLGSYFGFQGLANTVGNIFLSPGLGALYDISLTPRFRYTPWIVLAIMGILTVLFIYRSGKKLTPGQTSNTVI